MASPKIILITAGNNALGYEAVKAFFESERSYRVIMGSRSLDKGRAAAIEKLRQEYPNAANAIDLVQLDLATDESIEQAVAQVQSKVGYIDALINNAGSAIMEQPKNDRLIAINKSHVRHPWEDITP